MNKKTLKRSMIRLGSFLIFLIPKKVKKFYPELIGKKNLAVRFMNFFYLILLCFLASCESFEVFKDQNIDLSPQSKIEAIKIKKGTRVEVVVSSAVEANSFLGQRIQPNINGNNQGKVFIKNDPAKVVKRQIEDQLKLSGALLVESGYDRKLKVNLVYLNYRTKGGGLESKNVCGVGLRVWLYNASGENIYSNWYFVHNEFDPYERHKVEVTTQNINAAVSEVINKIFSDHDLIRNMVKK